MSRKQNFGWLLVFATAIWTGCDTGAAEIPTATHPETAEVERRTLEVRAEASGAIEAIRVVEVKSKASGEILTLVVETGDVVDRGALLAEIDPRDVRNSYEQAKADSAVAEARLQTSIAQRDRTRELREANVVTEQELETALLEEANSKAQYIKALTALQLAEERLKDVTVRAPIAGTIIERPVEIGTIIASASQNVSGGTTLMKMADLTMMQVRALVDETDLGRIRAGLPVQVSVEAYPDRRFRGQVMKIEPQGIVDQNVTMFPVMVELDNSEGLLKPGMNADVQVEIARKEDVVVVPNAAVVSTQDAVTAGEMFGIDEEKMRAAMQPPASPVADGATPAADGAPTATAEAADATNAASDCMALMQRVRSAGGFNNLSEEDRTTMRECRSQSGGRGGFGGRSRDREGNSEQRDGVVFVIGANGPEPRAVTLGLNDWDYTEVVRGVEPGEQVVLISVARLQAVQQEFLDRMRERTGGVIPGSGNGGGRGR
ncbi:MAG: efflux RND transporter periplasmic adaptor subunit [Longimicrobiales bacterium]